MRAVCAVWESRLGRRQSQSAGHVVASCQVQAALASKSGLLKVMFVRQMRRMHSACTAESQAALVWIVPQSSQAVSPGAAALRPACPGNPLASFFMGRAPSADPTH